MRPPDLRHTLTQPAGPATRGPGHPNPREHTVRRILNSPLARWGFPALAVLAATTHQPLAAILCGAVAALAWKARRR
jgi:hypothetical protein